MVTLPLSANLFNLLTALLFAFTELLLLSSLINLNNFHLSQHLKRTPSLPPVNVRHYRVRVFIATVISISLFLFLELLISLTSDPSSRPNFRTVPCLRSFIPHPSPSFSAQEPAVEALHFVCTRVNVTTVSHAPGNVTRTGSFEKPQCDDREAYRYEIGERINHTESMGELVFGCEFSLCGAVLWKREGDTGILYLSGPVPEGATGMALMPTEILRDAERIDGRERDLALGLANLLMSGITEEGEVRRLLLTGVEEDECAFEIGRRDVTDISTWAIWLGGAVWLLSVVVGTGGVVIGFVGKGFDMTNAEHWAERARYTEGRKGRMGLQLGEDGYIWIVGLDNDGEEQVTEEKDKKGGGGENDPERGTEEV